MASQQDQTRPSSFALIGVAGYVAPWHLHAIHETGNQLLAAVDPHDSVGILDRYFPVARFFTEIERFDRHLEKLRRNPNTPGVDYISICSPNYLHDAHVRLALRLHAHAICEKPLVINPWNLDALAELEGDFGRRVFTVLQLRLHPALLALKTELADQNSNRKADVSLTYVTSRGRWYEHSWKGSEAKSGGIVMNIGIHFFDAMLWLFGPIEKSQVFLMETQKAAGTFELERARVRWFLSTDANDLPDEVRQRGQSAFRSLMMDGTEIDFTGGFEDLHTQLYRQTLAGRGFGIEDSRPAIELVHQIRTCDLSSPDSSDTAHPLLQK